METNSQSLHQTQGGSNPVVNEFGAGTITTDRLGWLGTHQRYTAATTSGIIRIGHRLYDPRIGRFLQVDPIEGGSANDYDYVAADPINNYDLDGTIAVAAPAGAGYVVVGGVAVAIALLGWICSQTPCLVSGPWPSWGGPHLMGEHTKNARPSTVDKHTKPRSGRLTTKQRAKGGWRANPNKTKNVKATKKNVRNKKNGRRR